MAKPPSNRPKKLLTKSRYIQGLNCKKYVWMEFNAPEDLPKKTQAVQQRIDEGIQIEMLAKTTFEDALDSRDDDFTLSLKKTQENIKKRKVIFEAAFVQDFLYARADVLVPAPENAWDIVEIKSGTSIKEDTFHDVSFQKYVYELSGIKIRKCFVMHLDNQYIKQGSLDPETLFTKTDITEELDDPSEIKKNIEEIMKIVALKKAPEHEPGNYYCDDKYGVHETDKFYKKHPQMDIFQLYYAKGKAIEMFHEGIFEIKDVPEHRFFKKQHAIQKKTHISGKHHVAHEELKSFIAELTYPLYFMDFETYAPAVPVYDGMRPYEKVPFQFSVHTVAKPGAKAKHISFIAEDSEDPREGFIDALKEALGTKGSIVAYNAPFEKGVLGEVAACLPTHKKWVDATNARVVDLLVPFRNFSYYHPSQKGSASLKVVLPTVTGKTYEDLEISEGELASRLYYEMIHGKGLTPAQKKKLMKDLEEYCSLDTEGMVLILEKLKELVNIPKGVDKSNKN